MTDEEKPFIDMMKEIDPKLAELMEEGDLEKIKVHARAQLAEMAPPDGTPSVAEFGSPYAVLCPVHGKVCLTDDEYGRQLSRPDALWTCPKCGEASQWDDDHYEAMLNMDEPPE